MKTELASSLSGKPLKRVGRHRGKNRGFWQPPPWNLILSIYIYITPIWSYNFHWKFQVWRPVQPDAAAHMAPPQSCEAWVSAGASTRICRTSSCQGSWRPWYLGTTSTRAPSWRDDLRGRTELWLLSLEKWGTNWSYKFRNLKRWRFLF